VIDQATLPNRKANSAFTGRAPVMTCDIRIADTPAARANSAYGTAISAKISARNSPGWTVGRLFSFIFTSSMIVDDLDIDDVAIDKAKAEMPLIIDPDRMAAASVTL
jgi:hypothetical protein